MVFSKVLARNMAEERSKPLHNFKLPSLKWGSQRLLRCRKVGSDGDAAFSPDRGSSGSEEGGGSGLRDLNSVKGKEQGRTLLKLKKKKHDDSEDGIENLRAKLLLDLEAAAENMKISIGDDKQEKTKEDASAALAARPCNLRTRRAACKAPPIPVEIGGGSMKEDHNRQREREPQRQGQPQLQPQLHVSPARNEKSSPKSLRLKGLAEMASNQGVEKERPKFSLTLTREEIREDLLLMTGSLPSKRPKKRPKMVQKQLNNLMPGFWLTEVTAESYRVPDEVVEAKKK